MDIVLMIVAVLFAALTLLKPNKNNLELTLNSFFSVAFMLLAIYIWRN